MAVITFVAEETEGLTFPCRLDVYAAGARGLSRSRLKNGVETITVNGRKAKLSYKLTGGETVSLEWDDPVPTDIEPEDIPLDIVYEDDRVTVVNKKQGMVTHPAAGNWTGTLVHALLFHWGRESLSVGALESAEGQNAARPGIVHRLDKDTSGCIITAKNRESEDYLHQQFLDHRIHKEYIAIVKGHLPERKGNIKTQLVRDSKDRKKFTTSDDPAVGKFAWTKYRVVAVYGPYSLVRLRLKTGRTHQIRVHLKSLGCPIVGDPIYGKKDALFDSATLMLHARKLGLRLQGSEEMTYFTAAVPLRFKKVMKTLHQQFPKADLKHLYGGGR
ncbi:MAG: RluA family pseudouridine synthase [Treponemataceae bacterium]|nr:RluA family pseudouridine synthase [Treponemataceae bacterium]